MYNPWKMWGSYVIVFVVGAIIILATYNSVFVCQKDFFGTFTEQFNVGGPNCHGITFTISQFLSIPMIIPFYLFVLPLMSIASFFHLPDSAATTVGYLYLAIATLLSLAIYLVVGFLIGWGIHSLF